MKHFLGALLLSLLAITAAAQEGVPVKSLNGSGAPNANMAHVVGTQYVDISTGTLYVCTAITLTATLSQCTWTQTAGATIGVAPGSALVSNGLSQPPVYQTKPVIDVRDTSGIDCTGASDSASALNTLFAAISNRKVIFPQDCQLQIQSLVTIQGQTDFELEGQGHTPNATPATPLIFGCSGTAGPLLYINRSSYFHIKGLLFMSKGIGCTSSFTQGIQIDNSGGGGFTTLDGMIEHSSFTTNVQGTAIANYIGINVLNAAGNNEGMRFLNNWIHCQSSSNSYGIRIASQFSDIDLAEGNIIAGCFQGIRQETGNIRIEKN